MAKRVSENKVTRLTLSVNELAGSLGVHRDTVTAAIARGEISATRVGARIIIPKEELARLLKR